MTDTVMTDTVIRAEELRRRYAGGFEAVRGVSFSVERGEIFALLGTNGAGKTSTVELLEGLAAPCGGGYGSSGSTRTSSGPRSGRVPGSCSRTVASPPT